MAKTVFVGLSGGVDSAVSAALLKERGFNVVCVFIKIWQPEFLECNWKEDRIDAMRIAVALGLPFLEVDLSDDYKKTVVDKMVADYKRGVTPNPDVLCNRAIKFGSFLKFAKEKGADFIATGHYARIRKIKMQKSKLKMTMKKSKMESTEKLQLLRGADKEKDQSYFLHLLDQDALAHALFPAGGLLKSEVRRIARKFALPVADKPDSQGLCFVGDVTMKDFLSRFLPLKKGDVLDMRGRRIGEHGDAALYTLGQRHGFTARGRGKIHYVVSTNVADNTIVVSDDVSDAMRESAVVENVHWIGNAPETPFPADAQTRYRETPVRSVVSKDGGRVQVSFAEPRIASPGQSLVLYDGKRCLGGGIIMRIYK